MQLKNISDINKYIESESTNQIYIVLNNNGQPRLETINLISEKEFKEPFNENEFGYIFTNNATKLHRGNFEKDRIFTEKDEALICLQTRLNETIVEENIAGDTVGIYIGSPSTGMTQLSNDSFDWHLYDKNDISDKYLSLKEIYEQAVKQHIIKYTDLMTVFHIQPLKGSIYTCGNYESGNWHLNGTTKGYA